MSYGGPEKRGYEGPPRSNDSSPRYGGGGNGNSYNSNSNGSGFKSSNAGYGGPGGGGGGGSRPVRHMGEVDVVRHLLQSAAMSDSAILRVIAKDSVDVHQYPPSNIWRLPHPKTRDNSVRVGYDFHPTSNEVGKVRTNHFRVSIKGIPSTIYQYHVSIKQLDKENKIKMIPNKKKENTKERFVEAEICSEKSRMRECYMLVYTILQQCNVDNATYDGGHTLFSSQDLNFVSKNKFNSSSGSSSGSVASSSSGASVLSATSITSEQSRSTTSCLDEIVMMEEMGAYRVKIERTAIINPPSSGRLEDWQEMTDPIVLRALDTTLLALPRWESGFEVPSWFIEGHRAYPARDDAKFKIKLSDDLNARLGYSAALKVSMAGLTLVSDLSLSVFLASGEVVNLMHMIGGFRGLDDMLRQCPLQDRQLASVYKHLKQCKVKVIITKHTKKFFAFGPPANTAMFDYEGKQISVADYYKVKAKSDPAYKAVLKNGALKWPELPTINVGNKMRAVLVPAELVVVPDGQSKTKNLTPFIQAKVVKEAAKPPDERMKFICNADSALQMISKDKICQNFGIGGDALSTEPIALSCTLLPPARLLYRSDTVDPGLTGEWKVNKPLKFLQVPPKSAQDAKDYFGVLVVKGQFPPPRDYERMIDEFVRDLEREGRDLGVNLTYGDKVLCDKNYRQMDETCMDFKRNGASLIVVLMHDPNCYGEVKLICDKLGMPSQCVKWSNVERKPRGFHGNLLLKINTKMGGVNHTLASRNSDPDVHRQVFADAPNLPVPDSISFLFDQPTMFMGLDASRNTDPGNARGDGNQHHAIVASMDGKCGQYCAYVSVRNTKSDFSTTLEEGSGKLISAFKEKNTVFPRHIIVYRDGISDNQFPEVIDKEVRAMKNACERLGIAEHDIKISFIICQKRHSTRFFYEHKTQNPAPFFTNPCPGVCVDEHGGANSVSHTQNMEFYINSHSPIQGTCKPCKYTMIYDEIGLTLPQIELITYWTTYLYCRCNRSVSYATPAFYAHWASRRAKALTSAGANFSDLHEITDIWSRVGHPGMFFV